MMELATEVARGLAYARGISSQSAYVVTPVMYPNGTMVVCKVTARGNLFEVTDDSQAAIIAESMGQIGGFAKSASLISARGGAEYAERCFFIDKVRQEQLVGAVAIVANSSAQAVERLIMSGERERISKTRQVFETRIRTAFGQDALKNREVRGVTSVWKFDAVVRGHNGEAQTVFEFIAPQYTAVASSYMKLNNLRAIEGGPKAIAILSDYARTSPELRSTLSLATDRVMAADEPIEAYLEAA